MKRVLILAGGTGGHITPGLALASLLRDEGIDVQWLGTERGLESELVPKANIPISYISISGLRGKGVATLLLAPMKLFLAIVQAIKVIRKLKPDLVVGFGGFVSGPGGVAAWLLRKPLFIHEQNAIAGYTNRLLSRLSQKVMQAFPDTFKDIKKGVIHTGNPVRQDITQLPSPQDRFANRSGALRLLILGGSRGAVAINELIPKTIATLSNEERPEIWHQCGGKQLENTEKLYQENNVTAKIETFIDNMAEAYAWADLVVCRAGASTIYELAAVGLGSILIPYPYAVDDHQTENGKYLENAGAAIVIQQQELTVERLLILLKELNNRDQLLTMAEAAYSVRKPNAAKEIANYCLTIF